MHGSWFGVPPSGGFLSELRERRTPNVVIDWRFCVRIDRLDDPQARADANVFIVRVWLRERNLLVPHKRCSIDLLTAQRRSARHLRYP